MKPLRLLTIAVLLGAVAVAGWSGWRWSSQNSVEASHAAAVATARQFTIDFVSISASTVDADIQRVTDAATGEFGGEYARGKTQVRAAVVENEVQSEGTVLRAALVSGDGDSAVVLVAVDANVKNVKAPQGRPAHYRIKVDLVKEDGRWLVSQLEFVG
ncbi:MAG TPA: hypothetical protein VF062_09155 [Candidatus Limnocylindrales bacterium]